MNKSLFPLLLLFVSLIIGIAAHEPECDGYYPMMPGSVMELSNYNEKSKLQSTVTIEVKSKELQGHTIVLNLHSDTKDEKGKSLLSNDYDAFCEESMFSISMKNMITSEQQKAWKDMEVQMKLDSVDIPTAPIPGQALKDLHLAVDVSMSGMSMPGLKIDITNRKVESMEKITTPAGSFDCYKISSDVRMKTVIATEVHAIEWYSKGNGMIRSENYKGGKLKGYSELTKLIIPE